MTELKKAQRRTCSILNKVQRRTCSIPEAAAMLGLCRKGGYEAAKRGEIPTIKIGKRVLVPLAALNRMLSVNPTEERVLVPPAALDRLLAGDRPTETA